MEIGSQPLVLQTLWRSGGTYLAFKLRRSDAARLFYEPLHEDYSRLKAEDWLRMAEEGMAEGLGHPRPNMPHYLADYPFQPEGGVSGHDPRFAWERFVLADGDADPPLQGYLDGLAARAAAADARPIYKFCRGFLRSRWIQAALDARTVYLVRDPVETAGAYQARNEGAYFYSGYLTIARANAEHPLFAPVQARLDEAVGPEVVADLKAQPLVALAGPYPAALKLDLFYYFWLLGLAEHLRPGVLLVEAADFGAEPEVRAELSERLEAFAGPRLDFGDGRALPRRDLPEQVRILDPVVREAARAAWAGVDTSLAPPRVADMAAALLG